MFHVHLNVSCPAIPVQICPWYFLQMFARLCQQWHLDAKVPQASKSSSVFADVMPVSQPGVLLALYYGLSFLCMLQLLLQWWLRDRLDRVNGLDIWRIREAAGSSQHRYILLSSSCRISRMCLYIVGIGELVNFSRCQPFMQQDGQVKKTNVLHYMHIKSTWTISTGGSFRRWLPTARYPLNYFCSFLSTIMVGTFFGISDELLLVEYRGCPATLFPGGSGTWLLLYG